MIRFALRCEPAGHGFEGWFRSNEDFEAQAARGLLQCPACGASAVAKALMRPAVATSDRSPASRNVTSVAAGAPPEAVDALRQLQALAREIRSQADYVGDGFAEEARRIHYGESEERRIWGEASKGEVRSLMEEGITALPLPFLPEDRN